MHFIIQELTTLLTELLTKLTPESNCTCTYNLDRCSLRTRVTWRPAQAPAANFHKLLLGGSPFHTGSASTVSVLGLVHDGINFCGIGMPQAHVSRLRVDLESNTRLQCWLDLIYLGAGVELVCMPSTSCPVLCYQTRVMVTSLCAMPPGGWQ